MDPAALTAEKLVAVLQVLPESDNGFTPMMKRGYGESNRPGEAADRYGSDTVRLLQAAARSHHDYYGRCKRAAILWDWMRGTPMEEIEQRFSTTPFQGKIGHGDVRCFADSTRFHLRSAHRIATVMFVGQGPSEASVEELLKQLELGIPREALGLLSLPLSLSRGEYLTLHGEGIRTVADVWSLPRAEVVRLLGERRAMQTEAHRPIRVDAA
jgi:hypothetical protein